MCQLTLISAFALVEEEVTARDDECRVARKEMFRCSTMMLGMLVLGAVFPLILIGGTMLPLVLASAVAANPPVVVVANSFAG